MRSIHHIIHKYHHPSTYLLYGSLGLTVLSGFILSNSATYGLFGSSASAVTSDMKVAQASVTVSATCSMTANVTSAHNATLINGQYSGNNGSYTNGIGSTTINTICNDSGGYAIYAVGYTDNSAGNNKLVNNALSGYDIVTGTATSGDTSNWAMKVSAVENGTNYVPTIEGNFKNGSGESVFTAVPTAYTKVASLGHTTDAAAQTSSITTTYAAYISPTQPAGTYAGQVAYLLVHPNSNEPADDTFLAMQNVAQWGSTIKIGEEVTAIDSRDGKQYTVARLCMDATTPANCVNGNTDASNTYSRLWMTENLDLTIDNNTTYTHGDTDLGWTDNNTGATWTPSVTTVTIPDAAFNYRGSTATSEDPDYIAGWNGSSTSNTYQAEGATAAGNELYIYPNITGSVIKYEGLDACVSGAMVSDSTLTKVTATARCKHYHVGNYYNWSASVATTNTASYSTYNYAMPDSICPAGWRLPNGLTGETGAIVMSEFNQLLKAYEVTGTGGTNGVDLSGGENVGYAPDAFKNTMIDSPLYFVQSGDLNGSTLYYFASLGYYCSSTVRNGSNAYSLYFNSGSLSPARDGNRRGGRSVRCVAR